jgi:hypothetical protein
LIPAKPDTYLAAASSEIPSVRGCLPHPDEGCHLAAVERQPERKQVWRWRSDGRFGAIAAGTSTAFHPRCAENWTSLSSHGSAWPQPVVSCRPDPKDNTFFTPARPHLAWKTADGGRHLAPAFQGMREDLTSLD